MPRVQAIEERMRRGRLSASGFLGRDESLVACMRADARSLRRLGIRAQQIADRLECLVAKAERLLEQRAEEEFCACMNSDGMPTPAADLAPVLVEDRWRVTRFGWMGMQECPFLERDGTPCRAAPPWTNVDFSIERDSGEGLFFGGLLLHLIASHRFFEGRTRYRLDPELAVRVLELRAGVDYRPVWSTEQVWSSSWNGPGDVTMEGSGGAAERAASRGARWESVTPALEAIRNGDELLLRLSGTTAVMPGLVVFDHRVPAAVMPGVTRWVLKTERFVAP